MNGLLTVAFALGAGVRQGCPLSMELFNLIMMPLILVLDRRLHGLDLPSPSVPLATVRLAVTSYVDDATIILSTPAEAPIMMDVLQIFSEASSLVVSLTKSKCLPLGSWDRAASPLQFPYVDSVKVLGVTFTGSVGKMAAENWKRRLDAVRIALLDAKLRSMNIIQRVFYVNTYVLPLIWHLAHVIPLPLGVEKDVIKAIGHFIWAGLMFRVPFHVMVRPTRGGGLNLQHPGVKSKALFLARWLSSRAAGTFSGAWLEVLQQLYPGADPAPPAVRYYDHLRDVLQQLPAVTMRAAGKELAQDTHRHLLQSIATNAPRVQELQPTLNWEQIWENIHTKGLSSDARASWFLATHDVVCTKERVSRVKRDLDPTCETCNQPDTLTHRLVSCTPGVRRAWQLLQHRVACILGTTPPEPEWLTRPTSVAGKKSRNEAMLLVGEHIFRCQQAYKRT